MSANYCWNPNEWNLIVISAGNLQVKSMKIVCSIEQFPSALQNNTSATGAEFWYLILYFKHLLMYLQVGKCLFILVEIENKKNALNSPKNLVRKNYIQKYLTLPSARVQQEIGGKKEIKQKAQTCELSCKKSVRLKRQSGDLKRIALFLFFW